jgi:hypothetical protein
MSGVRDHQPVHTFGPSGPNESFRDPIRLLHLNWRAHGSRALRLKYRVEAGRENGVMVANQEPNRLGTISSTPCDLPRLLRNPFRVGCRVQPARCTRWLAISVKNRTYTRWSHIVSTLFDSVRPPVGVSRLPSLQLRDRPDIWVT